MGDGGDAHCAPGRLGCIDRRLGLAVRGAAPELSPLAPAAGKGKASLSVQRP